LLSFSLHFVSGKSYPAASRWVAHPKRSGRSKREKDESIRGGRKKQHGKRVELFSAFLGSLENPKGRTGNNSDSQHTPKGL